MTETTPPPDPNNLPVDPSETKGADPSQAEDWPVEEAEPENVDENAVNEPGPDDSISTVDDGDRDKVDPSTE